MQTEMTKCRTEINELKAQTEQLDGEVKTMKPELEKLKRDRDEARSIANSFEAQGIDVRENTLYQDNKSAILLEENGKASSGKRTSLHVLLKGLKLPT